MNTEASYGVRIRLVDVTEMHRSGLSRPGKTAGFESLLVAVEREGNLCPCGSVEFGFNGEERKLLNELLQQKEWPESRCEVSFLASRGHLRTAVFERLL